VVRGYCFGTLYQWIRRIHTAPHRSCVLSSYSTLPGESGASNSVSIHLHSYGQTWTESKRSRLFADAKEEVWSMSPVRLLTKLLQGWSRLVPTRSRGSGALSHLQFVQLVEMDRVDREIYSKDFLTSRPQRYSGAVHAGQSPATAGPRSCSRSSKASSSSEDDRSSSRSLNGISGDLAPARPGTSGIFPFIHMS
jgi:hypothetical protein